jgi:hypothetical protein
VLPGWCCQVDAAAAVATAIAAAIAVAGAGAGAGAGAARSPPPPPNNNSAVYRMSFMILCVSLSLNSYSTWEVGVVDIYLETGGRVFVTVTSKKSFVPYVH